jgi:hypothetical protein
MNEGNNAKLCDVANLILGAILLVSPWTLGFPSGAPSQNAFVSGIIIAVISLHWRRLPFGRNGST